MARKIRRPPVSGDKRFRTQKGGDTGPKERWQHGSGVLENTGIDGVFAARARHEHVLDKLRELNLLNAASRAAGLRLFEDYHAAHVEGSVSAAYGPPRGKSNDPQRRFERTPPQEAAYRRWRKALAALMPEWRDVVIHVACLQGWPQVQHLARLHAGLMRLARFYGIN